MVRTQEIGRKACDLVKAYEQKEESRRVDSAEQGSGCDLISTKGKDVRIIEVKADTGSKLEGKHAYAMTPEEWATFRKKKNAWLYIVYSLNDNPKLVRLQNKDINLSQIEIIPAKINIHFRKEDRKRLENKVVPIGS